MPHSTGPGSGMGGPQYGWGDVRGTPQTSGGRAQWQSGQARGRRGASPEAGLHRGEWQWRGHGPGAASDYGWEYQGGVARDAPLMRREATQGGRGAMEPRLAEERSGGLVRGSGRFDPGRRYDRDYGVRGGYDRGFLSGGGGFGGGPRLNADRVRAELERGAGRTRFAYRYDHEINRDMPEITARGTRRDWSEITRDRDEITGGRGIYRGYDGGFGYSRDYRRR